METRTLEALRRNPLNSKDVSPEGFQRTKRQVLLLGQFKPLLIEKGQAPEMIIGGHTRFEAYDEISRMEPFDVIDFFHDAASQELSEEAATQIIARAKEPKVSLIEFVVTPEGVRAVIDGQEQPKLFKTRDQAVMEYALADNDESGMYTTEIVSVIDQLEINPSDYGVRLDSPPLLLDLLPRPDLGDTDEPVTIQRSVEKEVTCPNCAHVFPLH